MRALKVWRVQHELSQIKLAELLGVTQRTVSQWERGKGQPSLKHLIRLQKITGLTARQLGYAVEVVL